MTATVPQFPEISGYTITEQLYFGSRTAVYRAVHNNQQFTVVIKVLQREYPTFGELVQFRNQYVIAKNLPIAGIIKPLSLEKFGNGYALVMADWGGISLEKYIQQQPLDLTEKLAIAIQLADILHDLHSSRVIHKDIKPANILIHPESKQVKLIDFSIASVLPKETQEIQNPNTLEGTLAYIAPEQTGRMNRGIDYRSDFYNFGVTLYQLLTACLPFDTSDLLELLHCHIAKIATPANYVNTEVPEMVGAIIAKLMAKNAEERYQSALGIKHDLQKCLNQWKETGLIAEFELAQRDLCDRFIIPEKLYGRETEVQKLLDAFERSRSTAELMLVAGYSGVGKTAVVNEVHKPITRQSGYFIKGKFDQFNRNIPFSAFVQAFRSLMGQLLSESDTEINQWKTKICRAVGESGQVLIEVIPELKRIIGHQPPIPELSGSAAQNRFNLLLQKFIAVFTTPEHPLVMFLDDLQWADLASLNLLKLLMAESETAYLLVLGAYRDNEVFPAHPLMLTLEDIKEHQVQIHTLTLKPLAQAHIQQLVADTLLCTKELAAPLAELVYQKTQGNPFFTTQFLQGLYKEHCITFDSTAGYWQCDLAQVRQLALTDDVVEFMVMQLRKLPFATQEVLKLAACIGNQFDLETLAIVSEQSPEVATANLWTALQEGLILPTGKVYKFYVSAKINYSALNQQQTVNCSYHFLHDRVQQAAYSLIPDNQKQIAHLKIGRLLLHNTPETQQEEKLFRIVNQLNIGATLIQDRVERDRLAQLNLFAGRKAKMATAYGSATDYFVQGYQLLSKHCWEVNYAQALALSQAAAQAAYLNGNFAQMDHWVSLALNNIDELLDTIDIHKINIQALTAQNQLKQAVSNSFEVLKTLKINLTEDSTQIDLGKAVEAIEEKLGNREIETLIDLPQMSDPYQLAAMQILSTAIAPAYVGAPDLLPLLVIKQVELSLEFGNTELSAYAYVMYGLIQSGILGDIKLGYQFGLLADKLLKKLDAKQIECRVINIFNAFIRHWQAPLKETLPSLAKGYQVGFERGEIEFVGYCALNYSLNAIWSGQELTSTEGKIADFVQAIAQFNQHTTHTYLKIYWQVTLSLLAAEKPSDLDGEAYQAATMLPIHQQANDAYALATRSLTKLFIHYLFSDFTEAIAAAEAGQAYIGALIGIAGVPIFPFYESLARLAMWDSLKPSERDTTLQQVAANQKKMRYWADCAPANYLSKFHLVEAEYHRVLGDKTEAINLYDRAIADANKNEYIYEVALANELAAKFYLNWGKEKVAAGYMQEAYYCYSRWGAKAKINDLEQRYPNLLRPILQQADVLAGTWNTLTTISPLTTSVHSGTQKTSNTTNINQALDFAAILKASQALSRSIELDQLLLQLTKIILQNSGGDRCALILHNQTDQWQVRAIATLDHTQLCTQPLANNPNLPVKLIQYVKNTQETVVINELKTDLPVIDDYLRQRQPKSLLCLPLFNQGQLIGILYLKNYFTIGAFTSDRVEVLNFLCTQAAISLENARLYEKAQEYAQQLEQSQLQVVQSEKMASLGNLVGGVAHEINNPIGFLNGSISNALDYVQDLFEYLKTYHQLQPPKAEVQEVAQNIDLDYLLSDLPNLLESMQGATDRITNISTSLRTFSRGDTEHKVSSNIHEGLDSTLLILKYRLKANNFRPAIKVTKDYGYLPMIKCFPGQLNQVFMNILANAIDMFDEMAQTQSYQQLASNPQRINIHTQIESNQVYIRIGDNGKGMSQDVQAKIFDHLFTTKEVGKGTGLGLAIARQIVVEKHGGSLHLWSEPGQGTEFVIQISV